MEENTNQTNKIKKTIQEENIERNVFNIDINKTDYTDNNNTANNDSSENNSNLDISINSINIANNEQLIFKKLNSLFKEYMLSDIQTLAAFKFIKDSFINQDSKTEKVKNWVLNKVNNKIPKDISKYQYGCPDICPGISIQNFYKYQDFQFVNELLNNRSVIIEELLNLRKGNLENRSLDNNDKDNSNNNSGFQPYKSPGYASDIKSKDGLGSLAHDSGDWNVYYLFLHELKFQSNCSKCPKTVELIEKIVPRQY